MVDQSGTRLRSSSATVRILDLEQAGRASQGLLAILRSARGISAEILEQGGAPDAGPSLLPRLDPNTVQAIFVVLPAGGLEQARHVLRRLRQLAPDLPVLMVVEQARPEEVLALLELGVTDFLTAPLCAAGVLPRLWRTLAHASDCSSPVHRLKAKLGLKQLVGESAAFVEAIRKIPLVAGCDAAVLISGETGTGKELCARAVHYLSPRGNRPFVPVNCGAIPVDLVENELFGHERAAFTGAAGARPGLIAEAEGGTLFLDEIDSLVPAAQVKLLRFLQDGEYRPLGSTKVRKADVRILAATNADLEAAVEEGRLRRDLYYRVGTIPLCLPPLRQRYDDIPLLARHFLRVHNQRFERGVTAISAVAMQKLLFYDWPGNVRELENVVERAVIFAEDRATIGAGEVQLSGSSSQDRDQESFREAKARIVGRFERRYLKTMLTAHRGNITRAAKAAQKNRRAFWELIRKHDIRASDFKS